MAYLTHPRDHAFQHGATDTKYSHLFDNIGFHASQSPAFHAAPGQYAAPLDFAPLPPRMQHYEIAEPGGFFQSALPEMPRCIYPPQSHPPALHDATHAIGWQPHMGPMLAENHFGAIPGYGSPSPLASPQMYAAMHGGSPWPPHGSPHYGSQAGHHGQTPIRLEELQALSRRVKDILHQCTRKLAYSRSGLEELFSKRQGFANHLREAEDDFQRMGYDWRSIEEDLKSVRETLLAGGDLSPRGRSRLLEMVGVNPNSPSDVEIFERLKVGKLSPLSADPSTEVRSTVTVDGVPQQKCSPTPDRTEAGSTIVGAILAAAGRGSEVDAIVEASKLAVDEPRRSRVNESGHPEDATFRCGWVSDPHLDRSEHWRGSQVDNGLHHAHHLQHDHLPPVPKIGANFFGEGGVEDPLEQRKQHGPSNARAHRFSTPQKRDH